MNMFESFLSVENAKREASRRMRSFGLAVLIVIIGLIFVLTIHARGHVRQNVPPAGQIISQPATSLHNVA